MPESWSRRRNSNVLQNHPTKERMNGLTKNHLKRSSFIHESKRLAKEHRGDLPQATFPLSPADPPHLWKGEHRSLQINTTVPLITPGDPQDDAIKCSLTQAMTAEQYSEETRIHAYTDESATDAVTNGGAGAYIKFPEEHKSYIKMLLCAAYLCADFSQP